MKIVKDTKTPQNLTIEKLRSFKGFANVSDAEAKRIIASMKELSILTYNTIIEHEQFKSIPKLRKAE
ncbi:hypothetical protein U8527_01685 [Kordia algicida OT-1]|uniref:Uncharacterized protein n=1 Tax=Kordia algicida OT-1 TaxID=391587 RepID=A9DT19_9FLAO|nr:hypothetical protein [Kordia algicida]EDP97012.1 hypothetical protein KAOT1_17653 [Kordia algicida OT-1]